jgi:hypothetical protein
MGQTDVTPILTMPIGDVFDAFKERNKNFITPGDFSKAVNLTNLGDLEK